MASVQAGLALAAGRAHALGEEIEDADRAATDIDGPPPRSDTDLIEQPGGLVTEATSLPQETLTLGVVRPEHVLRRRVHHSIASRLCYRDIAPDAQQYLSIALGAASRGCEPGPDRTLGPTVA